MVKPPLIDAPPDGGVGDGRGHGAGSLILIPKDFVSADFFTLAAGALHFSVLLVEGLLPEPLAAASDESAPGGLTEIGNARIEASDSSSKPGTCATKLSKACKESGAD
jgi:hypothetical protein